jgi:hypothetical protein
LLHVLWQLFLEPCILRLGGPGSGWHCCAWIWRMTGINIWYEVDVRPYTIHEAMISEKKSSYFSDDLLHHQIMRGWYRQKQCYRHQSVFENG